MREAIVTVSEDRLDGMSQEKGAVLAAFLRLIRPAP
jgi:hypothetical protein